MNNYSNKLDVKNFFQNVHCKYCIIKQSTTYPNYFAGSDIDIFCYNIKTLIEDVLSWATLYLQKGWIIKTTEISTTQVQIDFYPPKEHKLDIRLNIYNSLPKWKRISLKEGFFTHCLENAQKNKDSCFILSTIDECILRYVEFIEYYNIHADKIKHMEYIVNKLSDDEQKASFFETLHYYTELPKETISKRQIYRDKLIEFCCHFIPQKRLRNKFRKLKHS